MMAPIWLPVDTAPRDGSPVLLWIHDPEAPPSYPVTIGVWTTDPGEGTRFWHVFSDPYGTTTYFDRHVPKPGEPSA